MYVATAGAPAPPPAAGLPALLYLVPSVPLPAMAVAKAVGELAPLREGAPEQPEQPGVGAEGGAV